MFTIFEEVRSVLVNCLLFNPLRESLFCKKFVFEFSLVEAQIFLLLIFESNSELP